MSGHDFSSPANAAAPPVFGPAAWLLGFDDYLWKARKVPVLLVVLPFGFALGAWFPTLQWWLSIPAAALCLLVGACAEVGRSGKAREESLFCIGSIPRSLLRIDWVAATLVS